MKEEETFDVSSVVLENTIRADRTRLGRWFLWVTGTVGAPVQVPTVVQPTTKETDLQDWVCSGDGGGV